ncbi:hypothetical protein KUTeg_015726 [Tegillarca granosa]|uniref:TIR domain-containing protein n=1 Tax=Tegillarca granosa TaxID=220873 RepID=A0ABQ9ESU6_TEGGR|nr:hypothetical protein KUTeg_015726 [Tegillarca granosa]
MNASFYEPHLQNCFDPIRDVDDGSADEPKRLKENIIAELPPCRNYIDCPHLNSNETIEDNNNTWFNVTYKDTVSGYVLADYPMRWHCKQYVRKAKENEFDVFTSYSRDDYEWVKTLFLQLKSEGFAVCVDFKDFVPGTSD